MNDPDPVSQSPPASLHGLTSGRVLFSSAQRASAGLPGTPLDSGMFSLSFALWDWLFHRCMPLWLSGSVSRGLSAWSHSQTDRPVDHARRLWTKPLTAWVLFDSFFLSFFLLRLDQFSFLSFSLSYFLFWFSTISLFLLFYLFHCFFVCSVFFVLFFS